ncbi:unnamed protein product [Sphagnum balticum]
MISLTGLATIFQLVIAVGGYTKSYATIIVGRLLIGLATESLCIAQNAMVSFWFKGKELALAIGVAVNFPELTNALNSAVTPVIY